MGLPNTLGTANRTFLQDKYKKNPMQDEILSVLQTQQTVKELNDKRVLAMLIQMSPLEKQMQVTKALEAFGYKVGNFMKLTVH